ncbi:hypothetical protein CRYUN_Cryun13aG0128500 [Craigia yunnanensis]
MLLPEGFIGERTRFGARRPLHVMMSSENTVNDLITVAIEIYVKEKRRPLLKETDPKFFSTSLFAVQSGK